MVCKTMHKFIAVLSVKSKNTIPKFVSDSVNLKKSKIASTPNDEEWCFWSHLGVEKVLN